MAYTKNIDNPPGWQATDKLTGKVFNHLETQHDENKTEADAHNHDSRYYNQTLADGTFFNTVKPFYTGFDADKIDGMHYSDMTAAVLPIGAIVYWPSVSAAPTGWHVCDGAAGTPNLRDKFIVGAGLTYAPAETGGAFSTAVAGTVTVGSHTVVTAELPSHRHTYSDQYESQTQTGLDISATFSTGTQHTDTRTTASAGDGSGHGHAGSTVTLNNITATPPYYALYLIMKVS